MLYHLIYPLSRFTHSLNIFRYITFRSFFAFLLDIESNHGPIWLQPSGADKMEWKTPWIPGVVVPSRSS